MVWRCACHLDITLWLICHFFSYIEQAILHSSEYRVGTLCAQHLLQSFYGILLKLNMRYCHGLKMCMCFLYNSQINFCHFFPGCELCWPSMLSMSIIMVIGSTCECKYSCIYTILSETFACAYVIAWRYECASDKVLRLSFNSFILFCELKSNWHTCYIQTQTKSGEDINSQQLFWHRHTVRFIFFNFLS